MKRRTFVLSAATTMLLAGCSRVDDLAIPATSAGRPAGWTEGSHGNGVTPNYAVVFPQDSINHLTITITPEHWAAMEANLTALFGARGAGGGPNSPPWPGSGAPPPDQFSPRGGPPPGGPGGAPDLTPVNPDWFPATIEFNGKTWTQVGLRYKGNSTLRMGWTSGTQKLPFKLDFDQFEDSFPAIKNQRFYGFKQLSLSPNVGDVTAVREALTYDLLAESGLVAAETAWYEVYLDYGEGPVRLGLYTFIEVIDDTVVARHFGDDSGNIYEADGPAASLATGVEGQIEKSFQKENNQKAANWSDLKTLSAVLHSPERISDPAAWRAKLEAVFDVDSFLMWLGISAAIQHWDTYGQMSHNYYLYHDPATDRLTWISWDHNFVLGASGGGRGPGGPQGGAFPGGAAPGGAPRGPMGPGGRGTSLDQANVGTNWPLIRFLLDDPIYSAAYLEHVARFAAGPFDADRITAKVQTMTRLVGPAAALETGQPAYDTAVQNLIEAIRSRSQAVREFLASTRMNGERAQPNG
ncbi:MAG: CotH kinase family protein [Dehalococcoidia bacterium]